MPDRHDPSSPALSHRAIPFIVGLPLRADQPIFGRDDALQFLAEQLATFSSINIIAERRMGKTSVINHLMGNQDKRLVRQPDEPRLILAHVDLQDGVSNSSRFYGSVIRELLSNLPGDLNRETQELLGLKSRLEITPEANYDELRRVLRQLRNQNGAHVRPVVVIDEFERLVYPPSETDFPFPIFFDGIRALITANLLAMVIASRRILVDYFTDPSRPRSLTSTFPSYFQPLFLSPISDEAADELLLQTSDHPLTLREVTEARLWAKGHPCHLQIAGAVYYQAKRDSYSEKWIRQRREELKRQNCMVNTVTSSSDNVKKGWFKRALYLVFWYMPYNIGKLTQRLGYGISNMASWVIGMSVILIIILIVAGIATMTDLWHVLKRDLGL